MLDIGPYANDARLTHHDERSAAFYGRRASPAVYLNRWADGTYHAQQLQFEQRGGQMASLPPTVTSSGSTAAAALVQPPARSW